MPTRDFSDLLVLRRDRAWRAARRLRDRAAEAAKAW
jgi:hypothetical protein